MSGRDVIASGMSDVDLAISDSLVTHAINLLRYTAGLKAKAQIILNDLESALVAQLALRRSLSRDDAQPLIDDAEKRVTTAYDQIKLDMNESMIGASAVESVAVVQAVTAALHSVPGIGVELGTMAPLTQSMSKTLASDLLIEGAPSAEWWARQADDTAFRFAQVVRQGISDGQTTMQIAGEVAGKNGSAGVMEISRGNAFKLVHQSVQTVANESRMATFKQNADIINGVRQISTLDGRTSSICIAYAGGTWDLDGGPLPPTALPFNGGPPRHWNCRSVLVPITKTFAEMGLKVSEPARTTQASVDGQVDANLSFKDWLKTKDDSFLNELLGTGRAQLYRDGKITLQQLLDASGNPLTLAELRRRYD